MRRRSWYLSRYVACIGTRHYFAKTLRAARNHVAAYDNGMQHTRFCNALIIRVRDGAAWHGHGEWLNTKWRRRWERIR